MTHYPPCGPGLEPTEATELFERHGVRHVVFGHLHDARRDLSPPPFGERNGVTYQLTSCDYLDFKPVLVDEVRDVGADERSFGVPALKMADGGGLN